MRILLLGATGMLGHQVWRRFHARHDVWAVMRRDSSAYRPLGLFDAQRTLSCTDLNSDKQLQELFTTAQPQVVINCVGVIKQRQECSDPVATLQINTLLPHRLAALCATHGSRLIQMSTDCVFSGKKGNYSELDLPDATDLYGRSKLLGEVTSSHCLTLRSSIIGRELSGYHGLLEWFLSSRGKTVKGYEHAIFSGFTTLELARVVDLVLTQHPQLSGLWHVSAEPINKLELLQLFQQHFAWPGQIEPDVAVHCDRSLDSSRFRTATAYTPPSWPAMIAEMAAAPI